MELYTGIHIYVALGVLDDSQLVPVKGMGVLIGTLLQLADMLAQPDYQPVMDNGIFVIACNDYEREVLVTPLFRLLQEAAPLCRLQILPLGDREDIVAALPRHQIDLVLSPTLTEDNSELRQQLLFSDSMVCYYQRGQPMPDSLERYLAARHIRVSFGQQQRNWIDGHLAKRGLSRDTALIVSSFDAAASLGQNVSVRPAQEWGGR